MEGERRQLLFVRSVVLCGHEMASSTCTVEQSDEGTSYSYPCTLPLDAGQRQQACEHLKPSPLVAHCAAGLVRTFTHPLVYRSFKENLLHAMGGRHASFLLLKAFDLSSKDSRFRFAAQVADDVRSWSERHDTSDRRQSLHAALRFVRPQRVLLLTPRSESARLHEHLNSNCSWGTGQNTSDRGAYSTPAGVARHVGQMLSSASCLSMIEQHERTHGLRFDYVTRTRPDLGFLAPVRPYCAFFFQKQPPVAHLDARDFVYLMRREHASALLAQPLQIYQSCNGSASWAGAYEWLLRRAVGQAGLALCTPSHQYVTS